MDKMQYIKSLVPCPLDDFYCPYWDERYQKCKMLAETNTHPREEFTERLAEIEEKNHQLL